MWYNLNSSTNSYSSHGYWTLCLKPSYFDAQLPETHTYGYAQFYTVLIMVASGQIMACILWNLWWHNDTGTGPNELAKW